MASRRLLILLATISMLFVMASAEWQPSGWGAIFCSRKGGLYANGSQYKKNLDQLLTTLPAAARNNSWFHKGKAGSGADEVFGLIMCFGDHDTAQCQECLGSGGALVNMVCQGSRKATAAYDACMVRYSAAPIQATADLGSFYAKYIYGEPVTSQGLDNALLRLMAKLMASVTASPLLLAIVSAPYSSSQMMYGLAQCTRDLNASECTRCINHYVDRLGVLFPNKTGGAMKGHSCYLRYQVGAFETTLLPMPPPQPYHHEPSSSTGLAIGLSIGGAAFIIVLASLVWLHRLRQQKRARILNEVSEQELEEGDFLLDDPAMDDEFKRETGPKRFRYGELATATNNFTEKLGQGGSGSVYRGFLMEMNHDVAIKKLSKRSSQGRNEYTSEVKIISRLWHRNVVQLIGWCHERHDELLLVYELMPNGSLDTHLHSNAGAAVLPWPRRHDIVLGLGSALLYLHQDCGQCVLHRDIKPSNIMLDASFTAKLGDFGLARHVDHGRRSHITGIAGTFGYMEPEYVLTGRASIESEVYSFGVVLLEIACGRRPPVTLHREEEEDDDLRWQPVVARRGGDDREDHPIHIVQWVWEFYGRGDVVGAADARLKGEFDDGEMKTVMVVGLWCAHPHRSERPTIRQAVNVLHGKASLPSLPARIPVATNVSVTVSTEGTRTDSVYVTARKLD
ncbi:unnamed protein product [Urochloa humidicola]